jgi:hypothetical protein
MTKRTRALFLFCVMFAVAVGSAPSSAGAFGTVNIVGFGQHAEHERITRLALECRAGQPVDDGSCFQSGPLENVAGASFTAFPPSQSSFGAVGAADDLSLRLGWGGPYYWHCDDADYLDVPGYPQSRAQATDKLQACRGWARAMLMYGRPESQQEKPTGWRRITSRSWPVDGAVGRARYLLNANGRVAVRDPGTAGNPLCTFDGKFGRATCNVWGPWGYVLHAAEDFYSQQLGRSGRSAQADRSG